MLTFGVINTSILNKLDKFLLWALALTAFSFLLDDSLAQEIRTNSNVYFQDDFSPENDAEKYFFEGKLGDAVYAYNNGAYYISAKKSKEPAQSVLLHNLSDYEVETEGELVSNTSPLVLGDELIRAGWGISFNYQETVQEESFLLFVINPAEKLFSLERHSGKNKTSIIAPRKHELILPTRNKIGVSVEDGKIELKINEQKVADAYEPSQTKGGFGLYVTPGSSANFYYFTVLTKAKLKSTNLDDFSGKPTRWFAGYQDGVFYKYIDGYYLIDTSKTEKSGLSLFPGKYKLFEMEVNSFKEYGPDNYGFGLFFQDNPNQSGGFDQYRFLISNDGWITIQRSFEDIPRAIYEWSICPAVKPSSFNRLKVIILGSTIKFYVNDEPVYQLDEVAPVEGKLGLYVSSGLRVRFDDFKIMVYELSS